MKMVVLLKRVFVKSDKNTHRQKSWRRFLRVLVLKKCKREILIDNDDDIVRFRLSQHPPICIDCRTSMDSYISLYQHCRTKHPKSFFNAECCEAEYYTMAAFTEHCESAHCGQHICIGCRTFFDSYAALTEHKLEHETTRDEYAYLCSVCGLWSPSETEMELHMHSGHQDDKQARCLCQLAEISKQLTDRLPDDKDSNSYSQTLSDSVSSN